MTQNKKRTQFHIMHPLFDALESSTLTSTQRLLLIAMFRHINGDGVCYPSYSKLQLFTGMSDRTISRNIKELVANDWITYERGDKHKSLANTYHLNLSRLGFEQASDKVISIDGYTAQDGSVWSCASEYFRHKNKSLNG